jgi:hypothetical protein
MRRGTWASLLVLGAAGGLNAQPAEAVGPPARPIVVLHDSRWLRPTRVAVPAGVTLRVYRSPALTLPFVLSPGARNGRGTFYLVRLVARLYLAGRGGPNTVGDVSEKTDGATGLDIQAAPIGDGSRGGPLSLDLLDLISGHSVIKPGTRSIRVDEENYTQDSGIRGGPNRLSIQVNGFGAALVRAVEVLPGTGVYETSRAPATLSATTPAKIRVTKGATLRIPVRLSVSGDDARGVTVRTIVGGSALRALGPTSATLGTVSQDRPRTIELTFRASRAGEAIVNVDASGRNAEGSATTVVSVVEGGQSGVADGFVVLAALAPGALAFGWAGRRWRRERTSSGDSQMS